METLQLKFDDIISQAQSKRLDGATNSLHADAKVHQEGIQEGEKDKGGTIP